MPNVTVQGTRHLVAGTLDPLVRRVHLASLRLIITVWLVQFQSHSIHLDFSVAQRVPVSRLCTSLLKSGVRNNAFSASLHRLWGTIARPSDCHISTDHGARSMSRVAHPEDSVIATRMAAIYFIYYRRTSQFRLEARFGADSLQPLVRFVFLCSWLHIVVENINCSPAKDEVEELAGVESEACSKAKTCHQFHL